jgi:hypothetical protein
MDTTTQHKLMLKILIGSAWADRHLEPEETRYLETVIERYGLQKDPDLRSLLTTPVSLEKTELWILSYLKDATETERFRLLAAIGNLLIADHVVSSVEHDLLDDFHDLMASVPAQPEVERKSTVEELAPGIAQQLGKFFRRVAETVQHLTHGT